MALQLGGFSVRLKSSNDKSIYVQKHHTGARNPTDNLERPLKRKMDMRIDTWKVMSLYRAGALSSVISEIQKYTLDLLGNQPVK